MLIWLLLFIGAYVRWNVETQTAWFMTDVTVSTGALIVVAAFTGEKARWRWGNE